MAISRVQAAKAGTGGTSLNVRAAAFGSNVTAGNLVVVIMRVNGPTGPNISSIVDTLGSTYTQRIADRTVDPVMYLYDAVLASGGANTVTVTLASNSPYWWVEVIEYAGATATPYDTSGSNRGTGTTTQSGPSLTSADAGLIIAGVSQANLTTYTAGTNFTLVDGAIGGEGVTFGGVEEWFTSGATTTTATFTSGVTQAYCVVVAAYHASGGAAFLAGAQKPVLQAVNRAGTY